MRAPDLDWRPAAETASKHGAADMRIGTAKISRSALRTLTILTLFVGTAAVLGACAGNDTAGQGDTPRPKPTYSRLPIR